MKRILTTVALVAAIAAPTVAYAAHPDGGQYVVRIDGTQKGGFVKHWSDGSTQTYEPIGKAIDHCWDLGGGQATEYCRGLVDARYPDLQEWKRSLEKATR